jgi:hypothetical protein
MKPSVKRHEGAGVTEVTPVFAAFFIYHLKFFDCVETVQ